MGGGVTISASPATVSIPTGSIDIQEDETPLNFTVPTGITVLKVELWVGSNSNSKIAYVGVTPGSVHTIMLQHGNSQLPVIPHAVVCTTHRHPNNNPITVYVVIGIQDYQPMTARISWSPEINTHTPTVTDY